MSKFTANLDKMEGKSRQIVQIPPFFGQSDKKNFGALSKFLAILDKVANS